ncbi:hypothetical protein RR48_05320 [Papilio machaon]|uniref:Uncharacterized protein n=1 Tax=Papilio machaon TaxID=76193 RepID=A0A0N0PB34_PAPMA|nr:hypothetical protein RR48_05320 [Papilio machaon]
MAKNSDVESKMSLDSLEENFKQKASIKNEYAEDNVDTILVPFYEQDILIKVPKAQRWNHNTDDRKSTSKPVKNYLINKRTTNPPRVSYLEMFRKKNNLKLDDETPLEQDIRSLSPEVGDTERESIGEDTNYPVANDFHNTESYNEMYYAKLLEKERNQYLDNSFEFEHRLVEGNDNKSMSEKDNLRSVSEASIPKRASHSSGRRATIEILHNVKLGGLGPDMEKIKPRLERARSLQRYSEKVRMENRVKIYKKSIELEKEKHPERQSSAKQSSKIEDQQGEGTKHSSYLINKTKEKKSFLKTRIGYKSSDNTQNNKNYLNERDKHRKDKIRNVYQSKSKETRPQLNNTDHKERVRNQEEHELRKKSAAQNKTIQVDKTDEVPPVHISFMVNFSGVRPSSALKKLEAKHKIYQEKVKTYTLEKKNP